MNPTQKTGYPHIDKPWMKFYEEKIIPDEIPETSVVDVLRKRNKYRKTMPAYEYFGTLATYDELFCRVDDASRALRQIGVNKRDIIVSLVPNIPEEEHLFLGANQLGAAIDYIDPMPGIDRKASAKKLFGMIQSEKERAVQNDYGMRYIITTGQSYMSMIQPIENELKALGFRAVIILHLTDGLDENGQYEYVKNTLNYGRLARGEKLLRDDIRESELKEWLLFQKKMESEKTALNEAVKASPLSIYNYADLVKTCGNAGFEKAADPNLIAYIGHTSGTSGALPKPISLTNRAIISSMIQCDIGGLGPNEGETVLHFLPGFAAFGRVNNGLQTYFSRAINIHLPEFPLDNFGYPVKMLRPNVIMATPAFLLSMVNNPYLLHEDLSFITHIFYGGDGMNENMEKRMNDFLREHGSRAVLEQGYGLSETAGGAAYAKDDYKRPNAIGIPLPQTILSVVNPEIRDRLEPMRFGEGTEKLEGEIVINGGQLTEGTLAPEGKVVFQSMPNDGKEYLRTGDIGHMTRDGIFYSKGRQDRGFIRQDGYNVRPYEIEPEIEKNKYVENARIVPYFDESKCGNMPICHITLSHEGKNAEQVQVVEDIVYHTIIENPAMDVRQIPAKFKIRQEMPLGKMNKIDFRALENEGIAGDEIDVIVRQTNIAVDGIDIVKPG